MGDTLARDLSELQKQVKRLDAEGRRLPILLRYYLNLGGKAIAFIERGAVFRSGSGGLPGR